MPTTDEVPSIHVLMGRVLADLPAIGKDQYNQQQKFAFRGADDVLNALNPLLSKHGVFYVPDVIERTENQRTTNNGGTMYVVNLHVRYTFYGPAGDSVSASGWGEGTDMGDKATNKAMTGAMKYVLFQVFAISTSEAAQLDSDHDTPPESEPSVTCQACLDSEAGTSAQFPPPSIDPDPLRSHMVDAHGYVRLEDGRVAKSSPTAVVPEPDVAATDTPMDTPSAVTDDPAPSAGAVDVPPPAPEPAPEPVAAPNPEITDKDLAFVGSLKGADLVEQLRGLGLPVSGKVEELRDRLRTALAGTAAPEPTPEPEPEPEPAPVADEPSTDSQPLDEKFQCPDCDLFPFDTESEYAAHWNAAHDPDATDKAAPEMVEMLRTQVAGLRATSARAYGAYRRETKLPVLAEMTNTQVVAALDFIGELAG